MKKKKNRVKFVVYLMIIAMLVSTLLTGMAMFI